jgi:hypothetical protein
MPRAGPSFLRGTFGKILIEREPLDIYLSTLVPDLAHRLLMQEKRESVARHIVVNPIDSSGLP